MTHGTPHRPGTQRAVRHVLLIVLAAGVFLTPVALPRAGGPGAPQPRSVVILFSMPPELPGVQELNRAIISTLQTGSPVPVDINTEYTGLDRFTSEAYENSLLTLYNEKYARRKVDLLIVVGSTALRFVAEKKFLEGVPVVTSYTGQIFVDKARAQRPDLTGCLPSLNAPQTLDLMLKMYPRTRRIYIVLGATDYEREQAAQGRRLFQSISSRVDMQYLNDLTLEQMEGKVRTLADDELVLFASVLRDTAGRDYVGNYALGRLSLATRRPIFGVISEDLGDGIVGGILISMELSGRSTAEVGLRILGGERASSIPVLTDVGGVPMWDARQLKRWGIRERDLPPGSLVRFRKASMWDAYWKEISAGLAIIAIESALVAGLLVQLRRRRQTERELAEAEMRHRTVADFTHDWEFWQRPDGSFEYVSPACEGVSGFPSGDFRQDPALLERIVHEEDLRAWEDHQRDALAGRALPSLEFRIRRRDGQVRWVEQTSNPVHLEGGRFAGSRGSIRDITARKQGALDLQRAYEEIRTLKDGLEAENTYYREKIRSVEGTSELLGDSDALKYVVYRIRQVAPSDTTVLIEGETGTGKELVAEAIHRFGPRAQRPLVKVNCAALPPSLAESELFGHEKGAFTGALAQRKGRFELADGATLFLDEVGELSPEVQAKLLRVLQDGQFERVGAARTIRVDVRVIAATNRDLGREVASGRFREDLWYRLNVFPITVPALRQRKEDIPILAQAFVERSCQKLGRPMLAIPQSVIQSLQAYAWPGNVRELMNVMERAVLGSDGTALRFADRLVPETAAAPAGPLESLLEVERKHILSVLRASDWRVEGTGGAAEVLGMNPSTLRARLRKLGIQRPSD